MHPFREGNGRAQMLYLGQLASHAGYRLDVARIRTLETWIEASRAAHKGDYAPMGQAIQAALHRSK